jgi:hypothetical protein
MPKVTIWIKEEDYPIWLKIEDRPEWLHTIIQQAGEK